MNINVRTVVLYQRSIEELEVWMIPSPARDAAVLK